MLLIVWGAFQISAVMCFDATSCLLYVAFGTPGQDSGRIVGCVGGHMGRIALWRDVLSGGGREMMGCVCESARLMVTGRMDGRSE